MTGRTDMRQTRIMFLTPEGSWSVATPFLDQVVPAMINAVGASFHVRPISSALHAVLADDPTGAPPNPYLQRLASMFNAHQDMPFWGSCVLTGGFRATIQSGQGWTVPDEWVLPISDVLISRVTGVVAQLRMEATGG